MRRPIRWFRFTFADQAWTVYLSTRDVSPSLRPDDENASGYHGRAYFDSHTIFIECRRGRTPTDIREVCMHELLHVAAQAITLDSEIEERIVDSLAGPLETIMASAGVALPPIPPRALTKTCRAR